MTRPPRVVDTQHVMAPAVSGATSFLDYSSDTVGGNLRPFYAVAVEPSTALLLLAKLKLSYIQLPFFNIQRVLVVN
ncbi:hypothetical protein J6590_082618 [Homalodisca vitripennis]|nr:hypothetical protein J6590_082618 [Homalodisca vitripennis]